MKKKESFKKKYLLYILLACIPVIAVFAVFGDKGLWDIHKLRKELNGILSYNRSLEDENRALDENVRLLKTADKRYIGYIARKELGMIGKNEVVYRIEDQK
jgi:cell division protein FtsB